MICCSWELVLFFSGDQRSEGAIRKSTEVGLGRITINPAVRFGKAELLEDFPQLCHEDVLACLAFAAERERRLVVPPQVA